MLTWVFVDAEALEVFERRNAGCEALLFADPVISVNGSRRSRLEGCAALDEGFCACPRFVFPD